MDFRTLIKSALLLLSVLYAGVLNGQARVGDWEMHAEGAGTALERRFALTPAQPYSRGEPVAVLAFRRMESGSQVELMVMVTLEEEKKCDLESWQLAIDDTSINVTDYSLSETDSLGPAVVILEASNPNTQNELWALVKSGSKLAIRVEQKCGGFLSNIFNNEDIKIKVYTFSLRGSSAAYNYVVSEN